jgi:hypothetical protein
MVNGFKLRDDDVVDLLSPAAHGANATEGGIDLVGAPGDAASVDVDSLLNRDSSGIVNGRDSPPHSDAAAEGVKIKL